VDGAADAAALARSRRQALLTVLRSAVWGSTCDVDRAAGPSPVGGVSRYSGVAAEFRVATV
jgi:hypothetical protein